jgi:hypothetical protein
VARLCIQAVEAFEKNPADRYTTSQDFADDLRRFLENKSIRAKRASYAYQLMKWSRRHVTVVWSALAASLLGLAVLGASTVLIAQSRNEANEQRLLATQERDKAVDQRTLAVNERNRARLNQYVAETVSGQSDREQGSLARLYQRLIRHLPLGDEPDHRGWEWYYLFSFCHPEARNFALWNANSYIRAGIVKDTKLRCTREHLPRLKRFQVPIVIFIFARRRCSNFIRILAGILAADPKAEIVLLERLVPAWTERWQRRWTSTLPQSAHRLRFLPAVEHGPRRKISSRLCRRSPPPSARLSSTPDRIRSCYPRFRRL